MELTIEQKERLVKAMLGYKLQNKKSEQRSYPPVWNLFAVEPIENYYAIVTHDSGKVELVIAKENDEQKIAWHRFRPDKDIDLAIFLLQALARVSDCEWRLTALYTGHCSWALYSDCGRWNEEDNATSDNLPCELIVNACLWWIENNKLT